MASKVLYTLLITVLVIAISPIIVVFAAAYAASKTFKLLERKLMFGGDSDAQDKADWRRY